MQLFLILVLLHASCSQHIQQRSKPEAGEHSIGVSQLHLVHSLLLSPNMHVLPSFALPQ